MRKIFLDRAHGRNVSGKRSPDGSFIECNWSNETCDRIIEILKPKGANIEKYPLDVNEFLDSKGKPWLSKRVAKYNGEPGCMVVSLHVNGYNNEQASGFEIWAQKGNIISMRMANLYHDLFTMKYPSFPWRRQIRERNYKTWIANDPNSRLTILEGNKNILPTYPAVLIESGFMTNHEDLTWLTDEEAQENYRQFLANYILQISKY